MQRYKLILRFHAFDPNTTLTVNFLSIENRPFFGWDFTDASLFTLDRKGNLFYFKNNCTFAFVLMERWQSGRLRRS